MVSAYFDLTPKCWTSTLGGVMKKYTEQTKLSVVEDYCSGSAGHREVAHRHGVDASSLRKWIPIYRDQQSSALPAFIPLKLDAAAIPVRQAVALIDISSGQQTLTVNWPISDPEGCARFIRSLSQ